jgi:hypothetical protein
LTLAFFIANFSLIEAIAIEFKAFGFFAITGNFFIALRKRENLFFVFKNFRVIRVIFSLLRASLNNFFI